MLINIPQTVFTSIHFTFAGRSQPKVCVKWTHSASNDKRRPTGQQSFQA